MIRPSRALPLALLAFVAVANAQSVQDLYNKKEVNVAMRDGVTLHTVIYSPKTIAGKHPIIMERTPYSAGPYGKDYAWLDQAMMKAGYIFVYQDVRGQYLSQGTFVNVRPQLKRGEKGIDESTDTYDTVDWLVKNVTDNNGAIGMRGISYPGFYAGVGAINTHPALKAVSPQAPVSDWFIGDDVHHNGAFFLQDNFGFSAWFDVPRKGLETEHAGMTIDQKGLHAYDFYLNAGTAGDLDTKFLKGAIPYWTEIINHPNYDQYWKDRSLPKHFDNVKCAVLTVGGWFDAEDMWGALNVFKTGNRNKDNFLCMGPWYHGMWADGNGTTFGDLNFGMNTSKWYRENVEFPFFEKYLDGKDVPAPAKMTAFETGTNQWLRFDQWPPKDLKESKLYLADGKTLSPDKPGKDGKDSYVNDPAAPTPYLANHKTSDDRTREYMIDDQRWAEKRSDVLTYNGKELTEDWTVAGPIDVDFWTSTTGTDADFIVKVIDVWPTDSPMMSPNGKISMAGYEQNVRADIMRGRFRDSLEKPKPFKPGEPTRVHFKLNDLLHTFKKGHRVMIQVQSSWFPLVDRNPNTFVDIYHAKPSDFKKATITLYRDQTHPSSLTFGVMK
ncbi:CocE/NonD family hydrolase [soil metagenome]